MVRMILDQGHDVVGAAGMEEIEGDAEPVVGERCMLSDPAI